MLEINSEICGEEDKVATGAAALPLGVNITFGNLEKRMSRTDSYNFDKNNGDGGQNYR